MSDKLVVESRDGAGWIVLNRPGQRNAVDSSMWRDLVAELSKLASNPEVRAVALTGAGGVFSAGADTKETRDPDGVRSESYHALVNAGLAAIRGFPKPTLAVIDGYCVGGGCSLALACDVRFASPRSTFFMPSARMGLHYDDWSIARMVDLVGSGHTHRLLMSGMRMSGTEAADIGLVEYCGDNLVDYSTNYIAGIREGVPQTVERMRQVIKRVARLDDGEMEGGSHT